MTGAAHAQIEAETKTPYQLQVVLQVGSNRVFTPLFQEQLQRDVHNQLKLAFGNLARIDVTRTHPLLQDIETKGLDPVLESWDSLSDRTTHFVLLDYAAGTYQIQARFHDGMTGMLAPAMQRTRTTDRNGVANAIANLIATSFSPVGTVTTVGKEVTLKLKAGDFGVALNRPVERGHVFAVSRIVEEGGQRRAARIEWALLEVLDPPVAGVCRCAYWSRYKEDTLSPGDRAIRLPTVKGPVRLQLLDDDDMGLKPLNGIRVHLKRPGAANPLKMDTNRDGLAVSGEDFSHWAWVQVLSGDQPKAQFPVELIEGRTVVARVKLQTDRESLAPLEVRRDAWLRRAYDNVGASSERARELAALLNQSLEAAADSGRKSLPILQAEIKYLAQERDEIGRIAKEKKQEYTKQVREGEQQIDELRKQAGDLKALVERLEDVLKQSAGSEKSLGLAKLHERARLLDAEADFDEAIRLYEQVVQAAGADQVAVVKTRLDQLKKAWAPKGDKHAEARRFIYETWPTLDIAGLQKDLKKAESALEECKAVGDRLTPRKLLRVNVAHTLNLKKQLEALKKKDSEDNRNKAKAVVEISTRLLTLHNEASAFVGPRSD